MDNKLKKYQLFLTIFGFLVLGYNLYELITARYSTSQGIIFVVECLAGIVLIYLPTIAKKLFKLVFADGIIIFYWFFLIISVFFGTCLHLISIIPFWDKILHGISPMVLTVLGYGLCGVFLKKAKLSETSPWLFLLFGFSFAGLCGVFWEFWEFFCDQFFQMNLQRYQLTGGIDLIGRAAVMDTMGDLFTNTFGATVMGIFAWVKSRNNVTYFEQYKIHRSK
ncbi:hypothetical protein M2139_002022 [Enterococcus sp. PF1-24]|uniref:hypothetical protein n=1 Tax=unclassified Enterococcus TaxID=2608891 RepID=UPI002474531A|nr:MULTISPECIES: hypothetical protein [unclassified Enterococcus]MDH6365021.1 hypothetical protein [Enterococcus sp. PFB1-1]MDH6402122.1 hypothetical protein [Enterococcus sp. PF1-24]